MTIEIASNSLVKRLSCLKWRIGNRQSEFAREQTCCICHTSRSNGSLCNIRSRFTCLFHNGD